MINASCLSLCAWNIAQAPNKVMNALNNHTDPKCIDFEKVIKVFRDLESIIAAATNSEWQQNMYDATL